MALKHSPNPGPTLSSAERVRPSSVVVFGRSSVLLLVVAVVMAMVLLNTFSHPAGPTAYGLLASPLIGLAAITCWCIVAKESITRRRIPVGLIIAPIIGLMTVGLLGSGISALRFRHIDRPAFDAIVAQVPAPVIPSAGDELAGNEYTGDFPGTCPSFIGTLRIQRCASFAAGYLFY